MTEDPYIYPGTNILKNVFNLKDATQLDLIEHDLTTIRLDQIKNNPSIISGKFDIEHLKDIHKFIFGDLYPWAGELRTINIVKSEEALNGLLYKYQDFKKIPVELNIYLNEVQNIKWDALDINEKTRLLSKSLSDIWKTHGFREGNTRTVITFFSQFAKSHNFPLNEELLSKNSGYVRRALVASAYEDKDLNKKRNFAYLERIIKDAIQTGPKIDYSHIKDIFKKIPGIQLASTELLEKLNKLSIALPNEKILTTKDINLLYHKYGKHIESGLLKENDPTFKVISDIKIELQNLNIKINETNKNLTIEKKSKSIDIDLDL